MRTFRSELDAREVDPKGRRWIYVPYDQLSDGIGPLSREDPARLGIVLIESPAKAARRPYHKQKLALVLANMRHFALEQAARGVAVRYLVGETGYADTLAKAKSRLAMMEPAERELRVELSGLDIEMLPHEGWLTTREDFEEGAGSPWRMDAFYRHVRRRTGILMERGKPIGGKFSFDAENRRPWPGDPPAPTPPVFRPDAITTEVCELVESRFADHPGTLDPDSLPATADDAERAWKWALEECLPTFGPFEDAMSKRSSGLFHTRLAALINLHRLLPARVVADVVGNEAIPLASREGYVRQILGWREFVRHVHRETDGFRTGVKGYTHEGEGGAEPSYLGAEEPLPDAYWDYGKPSGLACLDAVVADVWREGWSHHISRLMVLSNFATLVGISPRALTDWFWVAYVDAYDWVVEPNVLAMGTYGAGDVMTTKPYVSGAAYIDRMSDYCESCAFDPKKNCPIARLYWSFLARNEKALSNVPRLMNPLGSMRKRSAENKAEDARVLARVRQTLAAGERLVP